LRRRLLIALCCFCLLGLSHVRAQTPVTDFSATPTSGCGPLSVKFTDLSTNSPIFWAWDFGNGQTSNLQNPTISYSSPGTYTVTLISRNPSGSDAMRKTDYITVFPFPSPSFTSNLTLACAPATIQFTDLSTPGQGSITSWSWNLGDGSTSNQQSPSHAYSQTGYYNVSLKVTNSGGCSNTAAVSRYLRVVNGIQPNFQWNQASASCSAPYMINFINQTAGPGNLSFNWSLGNGAVPANSTDTSPNNITYPANGNYTVTLQVNSSLGCTASLQQTLPFNGNTATITGPLSVCVNTPAAFSNGSTPPPSFNTWDFGDGTGSDSANTTKTWGTTGSYSVRLVNHYPSCADSITQTVQVVNPPTAAFTASPTGACKGPLTVQFTDQTVGATSWQWDFGDGSTSTQQSPSHTYNTTGSYSIKLTVTGAAGCTNSLTRASYIRIAPPVVSINNANQLGACIAGAGANPSLNPTLTIVSPGGVASYNWSAPGSNEGSSTAANPIFTYSTIGDYNISVTVTTSDGCTSPAATSTV
jgi:PKD repeat protein